LLRQGAVGFIDWLGLVRLLDLIVQRNTTKGTESELARHGESSAGLCDGHTDLPRAMRTPDAIKAIQRGSKERGERDNSDRPQATLRLHEKYARKEDSKAEESERLYFPDSAVDCLAGVS
jgi:hypothetical protein